MTRLAADAAFVLSTQRCTQLALARGVILHFYQQQGGIPAGLREDLDELVAIAREVRVRPDPQAPGSNPGSNQVRIFDAPADLSDGVYVDMKTACEHLGGMSEAAVRKAMAKGQIIGRQRGGKGCRWDVDLESVLRYAATRTCSPRPKEDRP